LKEISMQFKLQFNSAGFWWVTVCPANICKGRRTAALQLAWTIIPLINRNQIKDKNDLLSRKDVPGQV